MMCNVGNLIQNLKNIKLIIIEGIHDIFGNSISSNMYANK